MTPPPTTGTKVCSICNRELSVLAFAAHRTNKDGLRGWCRGCQRVKSHRRYVETGQGPNDYSLPERA